MLLSGIDEKIDSKRLWHWIECIPFCFIFKLIHHLQFESNRSTKHHPFSSLKIKQKAQRSVCATDKFDGLYFQAKPLRIIISRFETLFFRFKFHISTIIHAKSNTTRQKPFHASFNLWIHWFVCCNLWNVSSNKMWQKIERKHWNECLHIHKCPFIVTEKKNPLHSISRKMNDRRASLANVNVNFNVFVGNFLCTFSCCYRIDRLCKL